MKRFFQVLVPILLAALVVTSIGWYLFVYDRDFTRDMLLQQARYNDLHGNSRASAWFYNLAYNYSGQDENVAIELANQYKADGNYTKAEVTLSRAIKTGATKELYIALCKTYVEQDKLLDAVSMLANISDPVIKVELDAMRPSAPEPDYASGFYSQYMDIALTSSHGTLFCTTNGDYPSVADTPYSGPITLSLGETKIYCISVAENGLVSPISILGYTVGGVVEPVTFVDPAIELAVREILEVDADTILYSNNLWEIKEFTVPETAATLEDLSLMSFLEKLTVPARKLDNLHDFSGLGKLQTLDLTGCKFPSEELSVLAALPELTSLTLSNCGLSTIADLTGAQKLVYLDLSSNTIRNLEALSDMSSLSELYLQHNALTSLEALSTLGNLTKLDVSYNSLSSLSPLSNCVLLKWVHAGNNQLSSAKGVAGLSLLTHLYLDYNNFSGVESLSGCKSLTNLSISNNQVSDLSPIAGLDQLVVFDFSYNSVSALPKWPSGTPMQVIDGSYNRLTSIDSLAKLSEISYIYMDYNSIENVDALADCFHLVQINVFGNEIESVSELTDHDIIVNYDPTKKQ